MIVYVILAVVVLLGIVITWKGDEFDEAMERYWERRER